MASRLDMETYVPTHTITTVAKKLLLIPAKLRCRKSPRPKPNTSWTVIMTASMQGQQPRAGALRMPHWIAYGRHPPEPIMLQLGALFGKGLLI